MQIDPSDEQEENADSPRIETRLPVSNVRLESLQQSAKHNLEMVSTEDGMQIDSTHGQLQNADSPRIETRLPLSNVTRDRNDNPAKYESEIISIDDGMQTHFTCNPTRKPP
jgi:hypothetical protein